VHESLAIASTGRLRADASNDLSPLLPVAAVDPRVEALAHLCRKMGKAWEPVQTPRSPNSVLIVEDDADLLETLASLLEDVGCPVTRAANGQEALRHLRSAPPPGLILLDLIMPVMNGWVFRAEQRRDPALTAIPMVVMSRVDDIQHQATALSAVGYLGKPVDLDELGALVAHYCQ
jgi:CheY-like chemotaxis protein